MIIKNTLSIKPSYPLETITSLENVLFFDIETTGFSPAHTTLYLIGCCYYRDGWEFIQWFNETGTPEKEQDIISAFFAFAEDYSTLIHYNGSGFDIPYIEKKITHFQMTYSFSSFLQIDLYKILRPYQQLLALSSLKQKAVEQYLELGREDIYNGGQLIKFYQDYVIHANPDTLALLLTHNKEDIQGLMQILTILSIPSIYQGHFSVTTVEQKERECIFRCHLSYPVAKRITIGKQNLFLMINEDTLTLRIPVITEELKYFYRNYKDYYYLPMEDTAIHKSVAFYVDKEFRTQAKATTCYTRKKGAFLPQYDLLFSPCFHRNLKEKLSFFELTDSVLEDKKAAAKYVLHILQYLL